MATLIKANLNDLVDKAENPEKLLKQLLLDMQNQFMQVKTQVAIAIADQHLLEKKQQETLNQQKDWVPRPNWRFRKTGTVWRASRSSARLVRKCREELRAADGGTTNQVEMLRDALHRLEQKMAETRTKTELLIAQHRRAKLSARTGVSTSQGFQHDMTLDRLQGKVFEAEALGQESRGR